MNPSDAEIRQSHIIDDLDRARASHRRALVRSEQMLSDALVALNAGDVHIVDEFLRRVLVDMCDELEGN